MTRISPDKIILGVDLDEVVFQYIEGLRKYMVEVLGMNPPKDMPHNYSFKVSGWFDSEEEFKRVHGQAVEDGLYYKLDPVPGAIETLWDLSDSGYALNIITSRFVNPGQHERVVIDTARALQKHQVPHSNISFMKDKTLQIADLFIDDGPHNITALRGVGREVVTFDLPYNAHIPGPRVTNWQELRLLLKEKFGK